MLHHVRRRLHHAPCVAARAHPASLARLRYPKVLAALLTPRPRKACPVQEVRWRLVRNHENLLYLMQQGKLSFAPIFTDQCPYADYKAIYERMAAGERELIGLLFTQE